MSRNAERRQRIFLVGMMGSGKSTIGKLLAERLGYDLVDIDSVIEEHAGISISEIFSLRGEAAFRRLESAVLADTANRIKLVFATGGGILQNDENREIILNSGLVVWLNCSVETLSKRVGDGTTRPLLQDHDRRERLKQLIEERTPDYRQAHFQIDTEQNPLEEIVEQITDYYRNWLTLDEN